MGYEEGGQLTEAVHRHPYSVILLDEIEKAHPDVFNVLLQVFDDGRLTDGKGRTISFAESLIIMTSNIGSKWLEDLYLKDPARARDKVMAELKEAFKPEFLNRVDEFIFFKPLSEEDILGIVDIQLGILRKRLEEKDFSLNVSPEARAFLAKAGYDPVYGARPLKRAIQRHLENPLSLRILEGAYAPGADIRVDAGKEMLVFPAADV